MSGERLEAGRLNFGKLCLEPLELSLLPPSPWSVGDIVYLESYTKHFTRPAPAEVAAPVSEMRRRKI